jgi:hypothetical protein
LYELDQQGAELSCEFFNAHTIFDGSRYVVP